MASLSHNVCCPARACLTNEADPTSVGRASFQMRWVLLARDCAHQTPVLNVLLSYRSTLLLVWVTCTALPAHFPLSPSICAICTKTIKQIKEQRKNFGWGICFSLNSLSLLFFGSRFKLRPQTGCQIPSNKILDPCVALRDPQSTLRASTHEHGSVFMYA